MRHSVAALLAIGLSAAACSPNPGAPPPQPASVGASVSAGVTGATGEAKQTPPSSEEPVPLGASNLADELAATWTARRFAVAAWVDGGGAAIWPPPEELELLVLHEQRIYRLLASRPRLAERVLGLAAPELVAEARSNVRAGGTLYRHTTPLTHVPDFRTHAPEPADVLRGYFESAERRFGVEWEVLAAVMLIETRMGRVISRSSAGAQGPMQFLPSTWDAYGMGGDVQDEADAVIGAANYLAASGAPADYREALYHYNPVDEYVTAVMQYAKVMRRDPEAFYAYYNWQVFVRTTKGDVRLTGPGLDRS